MYLDFSRPSYLYILFVIPFIIFFYFYGIKNSKSRAIKFANFEAIARIKGIDLYSKNLLVLILDIGITLLLVCSLSGLTLYKEMDASSFSYVIAIDSSQSMSATDLTPNRIEVAKNSAIEFIDLLPYNTQEGILSFSGNTRIEQDITSNKESLKNAINEIKLTNYGGTDFYESIIIASFLLRNQDNKAIIFLSDGQINVGNMDEVVQTAIDNKIIVHTFAIGSKAGGKTSFGISKVDEDSLKSLAYSSGGKFYSIENKENLNDAFKEVITITKKIGSIDLTIYLIFTTIILFLLKQYLSYTTGLSI